VIFFSFNLANYCVWEVSKKAWFAGGIFTTKTYWCLVIIWNYIAKCTDYLAAVTLANEIYFSNSRNARTPRITRYDCNQHHASLGVTLQEMHFDSSAEKIDHFKKAQRISFFFVPLMRGLAATSLSYPLTLPAADAYFKTFLGSSRSLITISSSNSIAQLY